MEQKNIGVLFSSGLDSTYLVWKNLIDGNKVTPYFIELENNESQTKYEQQQIQILYKVFDTEFPGMIERPRIISSIKMYKTSNYQIAQPIIWATCISGAIEDYIDEIHIGYVLNDCAISYLDEIRNLYNATKPFVYRLPELKFPIIKKSKYQIVTELPEKYLVHVTSCENPHRKDYKVRMKYKHEFGEYNFYEPCGHCSSCKKIIADDYYDSKIIRNKYYRHNTVKMENIEMRKASDEPWAEKH